MSEPKIMGRTLDLDVEASITQTMTISPKELARLVRYGDPDIPLTSYVDGLMQAYARRATLINWGIRIIELDGQWRKEGSHGVLRNMTGTEKVVWDTLKAMRAAFRDLDLMKQETEVELEGSFRDYEH